MDRESDVGVLRSVGGGVDAVHRPLSLARRLLWGAQLQILSVRLVLIPKPSGSAFGLTAAAPSAPVFNFCFWAALFCLYIFLGTLTALIPIYNPPQGYHLEPQQIAVLAISFVFGVFTWGMVFSHIRLIALNLTTIEDMMFSRVSDHEATELDYAFGWYDLKGKSRTRKRWVEEFGRLRREGNPWWLGSLSRKSVCCVSLQLKGSS